MFEREDLLWFDAFDQWVAGTGPHPAEVCLEPEFFPLDRPRERLAWARSCAHSIRKDDPLSAAAHAGESTSNDYTFLTLQPDFDHSHRGWSAAKRAADKAQNEAWWAAKGEHASKIPSEYVYWLMYTVD